jgi:hypothetical protein
MNTIKHYLEQIKDPEVRERALRNADNEALKRDDYTSTKNALFGAFIWDDSPEGFDYWNNIYNNINQYI